MVELVDTFYSESIDVEFKKVVSVLVYCDIKFRVYGVRCERLMVGEAENVVAVAHVVGIDYIRIIWTFVDSFVYFGMSMQACTFPSCGGVEVSVWIVNLFTTEWRRPFEPVNRGNAHHGYSYDGGQENDGEDLC